MTERTTKLINQGTYGCIYKPSFKCNGKVEKSGYITKIQRVKSSSDKETNIGNKIMKIQNYADRYAPVIKSCPVSIGTIDENEVKKCDFINEENKTKYMSNKIKYVGKDTLGEHLLKVFNKRPKKFVSMFLTSYFYLLKSIHNLNKINVVHMDLKENNIIFNKQLDRPIIIDFGLSYDTTELTNENMKSFFYVYGDDYPPWCIDISIITYINKLSGDWTSSVFTKEQLELLINNFIKNNKIFSNIDENGKAEYKTKHMNYLSVFVGQNWSVLVTDLLKYSKSWDNYALAVIYYELIKDFHLEEIKIDFMPNIIEHLKQIILSLPNERKNTVDTIVDSKTLCTEFNKTEKIARLIKDKQKQEEYLLKQSDTYTASKLYDLKKENKIYLK